MKILIQLFAFLFLLQIGRASNGPTRFPLWGCWRLVSVSDAHGKFHKVNHFSEEKFSKDGGWVTHIADGGEADGDYTFQPPDGYIVTYNYGDSAHAQRFTFHLDGNVATLTAFPLQGDVPFTNRIQSQSTKPQVFRMRRVKKLTWGPSSR